MTLALPKGSLVLVTGSTGYIGSWITYEFIKQGYRVRAVVRSEEKASILREAISSHLDISNLETTFVTDFTSASAYAEAIKNVDAIVHVASDVSFSPDPDIVVKNVVAATETLISLAARSSTVKRFVLTSSSSAIDLANPTRDVTYNSTMWNTNAIETMYTANNPIVTYAASKTLGEKAFWAFPTNGKFTRNTVLPYLTIGPALSEKLRSSTHAWIRGMWNNDPAMAGLIKDFGQEWYVNVRDIARLHVAATIFEDVKEQRLLGYAGQFNFNTLLRIMREVDPKKDLPAEIEVVKDITRADTEGARRALALLGRKEFVGYEDSVRANIAEGLGWSDDD